MEQTAVLGYRAEIGEMKMAGRVAEAIRGMIERSDMAVLTRRVASEVREMAKRLSNGKKRQATANVENGRNGAVLRISCGKESYSVAFGNGREAADGLWALECRLHKEIVRMKCLAERIVRNR